jgi:peroxiredoxin
MNRVPFLKILKFAVPFLLLTAIGLACAQQTCPQVNAPAPDFTLNDIKGNKVSLSDFKGENIILNFWATWCGYCKMQLPYIETVYEKYSNSGMTVIAVNAREPADQAAKYVEQEGYTFHVLLDPNGTVYQLYCVPALPATLFINSNGIIKYGRAGAFSSVEEVEAALSYFN